MATWYVRPDTSHSGTRNGTTYATAWGGWSEITWGVGGVVGGDTLYVCGAHSFGAAISVGAHTGSSEATRCTVRGDYAADPGSMTFSSGGSYYLENSRNWTTIRDLTMTAGTSNCLLLSGGTDCVYSGTTFTSTNSAPISLWDGASFSRVTISGNTFRGASATSGSGATISRFVSSTGVLRTTTDITISGNTFENCAAGRAVIHFRTEDDTDAGSVMTGIVCTDNTFTNCTGMLIQFIHGHATAGIGGTLTVARNVARSCSESAATAGAGGFISVGGFSNGRVYDNEAYGIQGAAGFCNTFYGSFDVYRNTGESITTTTIDGNGVLFDHGASGAAWGNRFVNLPGKDGAANSGVGIMVLDATNVKCVGNVVEGCKWGVHLGAAGSGQSCTIANNTIVDCSDGAVYAATTADLANCAVKNNIFTGDGYSVYDQTAVAWSNENYNCFYGFASGASNHTIGAQSSTADPLLDSSYRLTAASPCLNAGTLIDGVVLKDFYGKDITSSPDIGAMQVYAARSAIASRSAITRSAITRSQSGDRAPYG